MAFTIGVLAPRSNYLPGFSNKFITALTQGFSLAGVDVNIVAVANGYNADRVQLVEKTQQLLMEHQVDALIVPLNTALVADLKPLCEGEQVPLIVLSLGEDVVFQAAQAEGVFFNSFELWHSAWLTGFIAATRHVGNVAGLNAMHDCGYGLGFAMAIGVEAAGQQFVGTAVTHRDSSSEDCQPALAQMMALEPVALIANYSGKEAGDITRDYTALENKIPLYGLHQTVDETLLPSFGDRDLMIHSISPWCRQNSALFANELIDWDTAHAYQLLAFEAAALTGLGLKSADKTWSARKQALAQASFSGPRGCVGLSRDGNARHGRPQFLRETVRVDGQWQNCVIESIEVPQLCLDHYDLARQKLSKQGWLNPYLIA